MNQLEGKYAIDFYDVKKYVEKGAKPSEKLNEALENLHAIYLEAQENGAELSEIHEGTPKEYAKEIAEGLPHTSPEKKRRIKIALAVLAFVVFTLAAFFTSDVWHLYRGGYNYAMKFPERVNGTEFYVSDEDYTATSTYDGWSDPESNPHFAELGIYFEYVNFSNAECIDVYMRSETIETGFAKFVHYKPNMTHGNGQYYRDFKLSEPVMAEINGLEYTGELVICDATGKDFEYWICFEPSDESKDYSGAEKSYKDGGEIEITFGEIDGAHWYYPGFMQMAAKGMIPFFVQYHVDEVDGI